MTTSVKSPTTFANDNTAPFSGIDGWIHIPIIKGSL